MRLSWFLPSIFVARGIGIATIVFSVTSIPFDKFTSPWHWVLFVLAVLVAVAAILLGARALKRKLEGGSGRIAELNDALKTETEPTEDTGTEN